MDQPESTRPRTDAGGSPAAGEPSGKTPFIPRAPISVPIVSDYDLIRRIGGGAYGEVWLARSKATGVLRAAKVVWRHTFEDERPFRREFEGIQRFEKISRELPGQLALYHIGRNDADGYFYYVMELADDLGTATDYSPHTLRADLAEGRLPAARVLEIGLTLAEALGHLHSHGLVHRDVKPSNVIFVNGRPKLADIGLVTGASDQCSIVGTEGYLPPEGPGTPQADIFAMGKVLYEATTGLDRREFPKLPEDLRSWSDAKLVFELNEIVLKACASKSGERYQSVEGMRAELQALQRGKSIKRRRTAQWWWAAATRATVGIAIVGIIAATVAILVRAQIRPPPSSGGKPSPINEANGLCRKGMDVIRDDMYEQFGEAYSNLLKAAELDPSFARPWVGLLELRLRERIPDVGPMTTSELQRIADNLDTLLPHSAPAYCAQMVIEFCDCHFPQAEDLAKKAIAADPDYELAHTFYAYMLTYWGKGRLEDARKQLEKSESALSGKGVIRRCQGHIAFVERNFADAIASYSKAPRDIPAVHCTGRAYQAMKDYTNAIASYRKEQILLLTDASAVAAVAARYDSLLAALAKEGEPGYWQWYWDEEKRDLRTHYYFKAVVRFNLGDTNGALAWLNASYTNHERDAYLPACSKLLFDEYWDGLHDNPRFRDLLDNMSFTKVMAPTKK
jgi:tetratricopeptide (TPR) repeat protein